MNATTNSGDGSTRFQYSFFDRASTWAFICRPWLARWRPATGLVVGLVGVQEGLHRHLGVDGHVLAAGEVDHHVGTHPAAVGVRGDLLVEVAVLQHPGHLDHPAQLQLPPPAAGLG